MLQYLLPVLVSFASPQQEVEFRSVLIQTSPQASAVEMRIAHLLQQRLQKPNQLPVRISSAAAPPASAANELVVCLGVSKDHPIISEKLESLHIKPLDNQDPGPEGYLLKSGSEGGRHFLIAGAVDERGVLYAAGEILRQADWTDNSIHLKFPLEKRSAPAFQIRGTQYGQSSVAKSLGKVRDWTEEETQSVILDYALAGANIFAAEPGPMFDFIKSYGLMTQGNYVPNKGVGPPEWQASESIGRPWFLCPSVPEARAALLKSCDEYFSQSPSFDLIKFQGGDGGGCECDRCDPYGRTFIHLVEDMASIVHKYHPQSNVYITNQKFDNDDDIAIFQYLQEKPRPWLWAFGYGPGSDAMSWQPGHRQTHRMDLFQYPGFGPFGRYCQEILHQLPPQQVLVFYNEITHWRYSQHGYIQMYPRADRDGSQPPPSNHFIYERRPDQALTQVYDRLTFYAWPRFYHWVFNQLLRYGVGDITHSSGSHDHFNQWMWQRLLWAPQSSVEDVVNEYCRTWFGRVAADKMAAAIFLMEEYLEEQPGKPITEKKEIGTFYNLVKEAGSQMPEWRCQSSWLWREFMQKASIDLYVKHRVQQQVDLQNQIESRIRQGFEEGDVSAAVAQCLAWFKPFEETPEMKLLHEGAVRYGAESNQLFGVRSEGIDNLEHDFIGLGWLQRQLERAQAATGDKQRELLWRIIHYEDAGEGGFYDNCGTFNPAPNLVAGYPYDHGQPYVPGMLDEANRPSQRSMSYTQDEAQGVTFHYRNLDPAAEYQACFTFVRPWYQERYAAWMNQHSQSILADGKLIAGDVELPERMSDFFTFDIPGECVADGKLELRLQKAGDVANGSRVEREIWRNSGGWGTLVSEVWLMRKDRLPWKQK